LRAFEKKQTKDVTLWWCTDNPLCYKKARNVDSDEPSEWTPLAGFCLGLCWKSKLQSKRREEFPSWSWTGWESEIKWWFKDWEARKIQADEDFRASVRLQNGEIIDWPTFCQSYNQIGQCISSTLNTLNIAAWTTPVIFIKAGYYGDDYNAVIELNGKGPCKWDFKPTTSKSLTGTTCMAVQICRSLEQDLRTLYVLLVCGVENGVYERVGFGEISGNVWPVSDHEDHGLLEFWYPFQS
jgi:hypothetical protein